MSADRNEMWRTSSMLLKVANEVEYANFPPVKFLILLMRAATKHQSQLIYRVLKADDNYHTGNSQSPGRPRNLWCWSQRQRTRFALGTSRIYQRRSRVFFYLYLVLDIYSRNIVGWQVFEEESSVLAADLMADICWRERVQLHQVTLHSDNGSPKKGATMLATLQQLGIVPSFSCPAISNDNPYSESLFRTLKYQPAYPDQTFAYLLSSRRWVKALLTGITMSIFTVRSSLLHRISVTRGYQAAKKRHLKS